MLSQISLRALSSIWVVIALSVGLLVSAIWFYSVRAWQDHLNQAYSVGVETFYSLETGKIRAYFGRATTLLYYTFVNDG